MPVIKFVNEENKERYDTEESVYNLIYYIFNECKTTCDDVRPGYAIGDFAGCSHFFGPEYWQIRPDIVVGQMIANNCAYGKREFNLLKHRIISFSNDECVVPHEALKLAKHIADAYGENYITAYGIHLDSKSIHIHLAVDCISWKDGKRFSVSYEYRWISAMVQGWMAEYFNSLIINPKKNKKCEQYFGLY